MKQLTVISGKGGTGKTSISAAFASLAKNAVFADCDVDAADLHLILKPKIKKKTVFHGFGSKLGRSLGKSLSEEITKVGDCGQA